MRKRSFWVIALLLVLNLFILTLLYSEGMWITKINKEKISLKEFNDSYRAVISFGAMNSPIPVPKKDIDKILADKERRKLFLRTFEDDYLIIKKAKQKNIYNETQIDKQVKSITKLLKRQLIKKEFYIKYIYPKVRVSSKEVNKVYKKEKNNKLLKGMSSTEIRKIIKSQLKARKAQIKLKEYTEKLRLESIIIHNESLL